MSSHGNMKDYRLGILNCLLVLGLELHLRELSLGPQMIVTTKQCGWRAVMWRALRVFRINTCSASASILAQSSPKHFRFVTHHTSIPSGTMSPAPQWPHQSSPFHIYGYFVLLVFHRRTSLPLICAFPATHDVAHMLLATSSTIFYTIDRIQTAEPFTSTISSLIGVFRKRCPRAFLPHRKEVFRCLGPVKFNTHIPYGRTLDGHLTVLRHRGHDNGKRNITSGHYY